MNPDNVENFDSGRFSNFNYWNTAYEYLRNINTFFAKYEEAQVTEELKSRLYGEMKFIRAFVYSNLIWWCSYYYESVYIGRYGLFYHTKYV